MADLEEMSTRLPYLDGMVNIILNLVKLVNPWNFRTNNK